MKTVGLVVEYNPLHNGHLYHYEQSLKTTGADACVAVMSGFFLQRGEPAMVNKWARAEMALALGIDLILELPLAFSAQNAEIFAFGAISTLHSLGVVDYVCFGSESGELTLLDTLSEYLINEPVSFKMKMKELLRQGLSYPKAYGSAISSLLGIPDNITQQPNNILGLNYLMALKKLQSNIKAATITRTKAGYHQESITDTSIASATAIRKLLANSPVHDIGPFVPKTTLDILLRESSAGRCPIQWEHFYPYLIQQLACRSIEELREIYEMEEGLEYRLKKEFVYTRSFAELMERVKTKRYTWNRLQRLFFYVLLNIKKKDMLGFDLKGGAPYIRVLGFNDKGQELLARARKSALVPIYTNIPKDPPPLFELDIRASTIYQLGSPEASGHKQFNSEYYRVPIRMKKP